MKHLKTFEQSQEKGDIAFSIGDVVINPKIGIGTKFRIQRIYRYNNEKDPQFGSKIDIESLPESQHDKSHFVDILNLTDFTPLDGVWSKDVMTEIKYNSNKFNL